MIPEELRHALRHCRGAHGWSSRHLSAASSIPPNNHTLSHVAKYRSLMPSLALILHLIDGVDAGPGGPVSRAAAAQAAAWCEYLAAHARRLYAAVTDAARVAAPCWRPGSPAAGWRARSPRARCTARSGPV